MLLYFVPNLANNKFIKFLSKFTKSVWWIILISLLTLASEIFAIEIYIYYAFVVLCALLPALLCEDMSAAIAPFAMGYMTFSRYNNSADLNRQMFANKTFIINLIIISALLVVILITRLVIDCIKRKRVYNFPRLTIGFAALGTAFILGGLFTKYFDGKTAFFGLVQIVSLSLTYFYFFYTIDWPKYNKNAFAYLVVAVSLVAIVQAICAKYYVTERIYHLDVPAAMNDRIVSTGWGVRTNIGGQIVWGIFGSYYLMTRKKQPWVWAIIATAICFGVSVTESRGPMLTTFAAAFIGMVVTIIVTKKMMRVKTICAFVGVLITLSVVIPVFWNAFFREFFGRLIDTIVESDSINEFSSNRIEIYKLGLQMGIKNPIFGTGWYSSNAYRADNFATSFIPSRWHDTFVQIFASCGFFGLLAFAFHRFEMFRMLFKKISVHKVYITLTVGTFCVASLFDCFFSNIGPGLLYGILLVMFEMSPVYEDIKNFKESTNDAPIAQLDRVLGFEPRGCGSESYLGRHHKKCEKHKRIKKPNFKKLLNGFYAYLEENNIVINDDFAFGCELGRFLQDNLPDYRVETMKNVKYFFNKQEVNKFRIDIAVVAKDRSVGYAIQTSYPTKNTLSKEMYKMVRDIKFAEELEKLGFTNVFVLALTKDRRFIESRNTKLEKYFGKKKMLTSKVYEPKTKNKFIKLEGFYRIRWTSRGQNGYSYQIKL